jgi:preprotein translocase subunit Sec61beta
MREGEDAERTLQVHRRGRPSPGREPLNRVVSYARPMAKQEKNTGFQQSAGLIRYFDAEEETAIKIDARLVFIFALIMCVLILFVEQYPSTRLT